jgi:nitrate/nitrite transporter NarK
MSNISFFFPKKIQGYSLGMNAGLGNFGVTTMQIVIPLVLHLNKTYPTQTFIHTKIQHWYKVF